MAAGQQSKDAMHIMGDYGLVQDAYPNNVILNDQPNKIVVEINKGKCLWFEVLNVSISTIEIAFFLNNQEHCASLSTTYKFSIWISDWKRNQHSNISVLHLVKAMADMKNSFMIALHLSIYSKVANLMISC